MKSLIGLLCGTHTHVYYNVGKLEIAISPSNIPLTPTNFPNRPIFSWLHIHLPNQNRNLPYQTNLKKITHNNPENACPNQSTPYHPQLLLLFIILDALPGQPLAITIRHAPLFCFNASIQHTLARSHDQQTTNHVAPT